MLSQPLSNKSPTNFSRIRKVVRLFRSLRKSSLAKSSQKKKITNFSRNITTSCYRLHTHTHTCIYTSTKLRRVIRLDAWLPGCCSPRSAIRPATLPFSPFSSRLFIYLKPVTGFAALPQESVAREFDARSDSIEFPPDWSPLWTPSAASTRTGIARIFGLDWLLRVFPRFLQ